MAKKKDQGKKEDLAVSVSDVLAEAEGVLNTAMGQLIEEEPPAEEEVPPWEDGVEEPEKENTYHLRWRTVGESGWLYDDPIPGAHIDYTLYNKEGSGFLETIHVLMPIGGVYANALEEAEKQVGAMRQTFSGMIGQEQERIRKEMEEKHKTLSVIEAWAVVGLRDDEVIREHMPYELMEQVPFPIAKVQGKDMTSVCLGQLVTEDPGLLAWLATRAKMEDDDKMGRLAKVCAQMLISRTKRENAINTNDLL